MKAHTCKHNGTKWEGTEACEACAEYDSIMQRASAAQTCPYNHHCERFEYIRSEWSNDPQKPYSVWGTENDGEYYKRETLHTGTKEECETYIASFPGLTPEEQDDYGLSAYPTLSLEENGRCWVCDAYDKRRADVRKGIHKPFVIAVWSISRHYGGPEEGGWYYDWTTVDEVRKVHTLEAGLRAARELKAAYPQPRFNRFSCANRGEGDVFIGVFYGENDPRFPQNSTHRPRYE